MAIAQEATKKFKTDRREGEIRPGGKSDKLQEKIARVG